MPRALFTSKTREELIAADPFAKSRRLKTSTAEDQFELGKCQVTCRYWREGGDFVSKQILGCHNAIRVGRLRSQQKKVALERVENTQTVIGIVGDEADVAELAGSLTKSFPGVIITEDAAIVAG